MPLPADIHARRYYRVAYQRLEDGELVLKDLNRPNASIYLTGYAVECMLKALLIMATPRNERPTMIRTHDLHELRQRLEKLGISFTRQEREDLRLLNTWSTDIRYEPGQGDEEEAEQFLGRATRLTGSIEQRMV